MKTTFVFLAVVAAAGLGLMNRSLAADPVLSPKAAELRHDFRTVPGITPDLLDRSVKPASPKALEVARDHRTVPGVTENVTVYRRPPTVSPRLLANEPWRLEKVEVAPLK